ncbi:MAG TPA: SMP-30/gluconolactonase/LRE family protein [Bryobacteraceae bacterium]
MWAWSLAVSPSFAQLPAAGALSDQERPLFLAEVGRIQRLLTSAPETAAVTYQMARTWAAAKQWPEAVEWLRKAVAPGAGIDPTRDSVFAELRGTREFDSIVSAVREATPPISHSRSAFTVPEGDLVPESIAYDPTRKSFYLGSMKKGKVIRCSGAGDCAQFAGALGTVLGLKVYQRGLWLLNNSDTESALIHYDLASGRLIRRYAVTGSGHSFNDLAIASTGDVYLTDTRAGAVWRLAQGADNLTRLPDRFEFANGIALSAEGNLLYVSRFPDGITLVDLKTNAAMPIGRPSGLCLAAIDGLYFYRGALIAIQNGFMTPRVARFSLSRDLRAIERVEILERRNPLFEGITTGVVVGDDFFYMANVQDDKQGSFDPIAILKLPL